MAVGFLLSSLRRIAGAILVTAAVATWPASPTAAQQTDDARDVDDVRNTDCDRIPGGNAPVQRIARLQGGLSVRNLELTYFEKPLFALTDNDIDYLQNLWPQCGTFESDVAAKIAPKLKALISDAKIARQDTLDWIGEVEAQIARLEKLRAERGDITPTLAALTQCARSGDGNLLAHCVEAARAGEAGRGFISRPQNT